MNGLFLTSCQHWWEQVNDTVIEFHLSETSGLRRARTWIAGLVDRDANDCAISPPHSKWWQLYHYKSINVCCFQICDSIIMMVLYSLMAELISDIFSC